MGHFQCFCGFSFSIGKRLFNMFGSHFVLAFQDVQDHVVRYFQEDWRDVSACPVQDPNCNSNRAAISNVLTHLPPLLCIQIVRMPANGSRKLRDEGKMPSLILDLRAMVNTKLRVPKGCLLTTKLSRSEYTGVCRGPVVTACAFDMAFFVPQLCRFLSFLLFLCKLLKLDLLVK